MHNVPTSSKIKVEEVDDIHPKKFKTKFNFHIKPAFTKEVTLTDQHKVKEEISEFEEDINQVVVTPKIKSTPLSQHSNEPFPVKFRKLKKIKTKHVSFNPQQTVNDPPKSEISTSDVNKSANNTESNNRKRKKAMSPTKLKKKISAHLR